MNFFITILSLFVLLLVPASAEPAIEIEKLASKSMKEVTKILGKPVKQEKVRAGLKAIYKGGQVEVVFINDEADWITVSNLKSLPFDERAIEAIGLKPESPTTKTERVIAWEPHSNYRSVSIFPAGEKVDYIYIKVFTK